MTTGIIYSRDSHVIYPDSTLQDLRDLSEEMEIPLGVP